MLEIGRKPGAYRVYLIYSAATALFLSLAWTVNMVYQVEVVGLNPLQLVLVGTALELSYFLFEIPTGVVADAYSRRLSVIIGTALVGAGFIVMGAVPAFEVLVLSQVICGIGYTFLSGALEAWIADEVGEHRAGGAFVRGAQAGQVGTLVGVVVAVVLGSVWLQLPIITGGVLLCLTAGILIVIMTETAFRRVPRDERGNWSTMRSTFGAGVGLIRSRPLLVTILGIAAVFGTFSEGFDRLWTPHLLENFTLPALGPLPPLYWFAIINVAFNVLGLAALEVARRHLNMNSHRVVTRALIGLNLGVIVTVVVFGLTGSVAVALIALIGGSVMRKAIYPLKTAWINQSIDSSVRATVLSIADQADSFGQIGGGPVVGTIGTVVSLRAAIVTAGLVLTPGLLLYARALGQGAVVEGVGSVEQRSTG
jgi:DHA3 family tetracycline resistance protein-like MFS transporter